MLDTLALGTAYLVPASLDGRVISSGMFRINDANFHGGVNLHLQT